MRKSFTAVLLSFLLLFTGFTQSGCSAAQFTTVLNEVGPALGVVLQIIAISQGVPANAALLAKVTADTNALNTLYPAFVSAATANKGNVEAQINAEFQVLETDIGEVFTLAHVTNPATQTKVTTLIGLVQGLVQIAEGFVPHPAPALAVSRARGVTSAQNTPVPTAAEFEKTWNQVLTAKTGEAKVDAYTAKHRYHQHGLFVRVATAGLAK
jgi:hypothetical protein